MAVAIPLVAVAAGAYGVATAATAIGMLAAGATMVSGIASLAGKPKIAKIAGLVALGAGAFTALAGAGALEAGAAAAGEQTATEAALSGMRGNTAIADNAAGSLLEAAKDTSSSLASAATDVATADAASINSALAGSGGPAAGGLTELASAGTGPSWNFADVTANASQLPANMDINGVIRGATTAPSPVSLSSPGVPSAAAAGPSATTSLLDKVSAIGKWMNENKELVKLGGGMLEGAFGTEAQKLSLLEQEIARRNANANNIVGLRVPAIVNPNSARLRANTTGG
jgi:hypothetical protein